MTGAPVDMVFKISILGSMKIEKKKIAYDLLSKITGIDDLSVISACKLSGFDVCCRSDPMLYKPIEEINPDSETIYNIQVMVNRSIEFFKEYGPVTLDGFNLIGGYTDTIDKGDGDFITESTLWDFKVSIKPPTKNHTLQILIYYLMGIKSIHNEFDSITKLGVFNPRLNKIFFINIEDISQSTIDVVNSEVIGY